MPANSLGLLSSPTTTDLEMLEANVIEQRPSLPTSLSDFALFPSSSSAPSSPSSLSALDDNSNLFFRRLRRSSLLVASPLTASAEVNSPLAASFTPRSRRAQSVDSEKMADDASSETPSRGFHVECFLPTPNETLSSPPSPSTTNEQTNEPLGGAAFKRILLPPKPARLLDLRSEINSPIESELKSEAQFQRLLASYTITGLPSSKTFPHTPRPRAWSDRGRYPEEAVGDDDVDQGVESASDDGDDVDNSGQSMSITPGGSGGSGEDHPMTIDTNVNNGFMMDIDQAWHLCCPRMLRTDSTQPSSHSAISSPTQWRQTPPPTSSRSNKRKFDDRYDPYPLAVKRRAVSPALHVHPHHHHSHSHSHSPRGSISHPSAIAIAIPIPRGTRSVTSSPVMRPTSSPVMRPSSFGHGTSSPTMRPIARLPPLASLRGGSDSEKEREKNRKNVEGAGEAVGCLSLAEQPR
ncbi:hypothetical protein BU17DRAFT_67308 [Hysterangium stoloniferum]|nr:hypothetical protein BU17DRAFT_67308 [Hysterangium stoloniferum]